MSSLNMLRNFTSIGSLIAMSSASQLALSQTNQLGYVARGAYRNAAAVPESRQADYWFRDVMMAVATAWYYELAYRALYHFYTHPQLTRVLGLNRLVHDYQDTHPNIPLRDYRSIEEIPKLRTRLTSSIAKKNDDSFIPSLLQDIDGYGSTEQGKLLITHLKSKLNFPEYLDAMAEMSPPKKELFQQVKTLFTRYNEQLATEEPFQAFEQQLEKEWMGSRSKPPDSEDVKRFLNVLESLNNKISEKEAFLSSVKNNPELAELLVKGIHSKTTLKVISNFQKGANFPQLLAASLAMFICFGLIGNRFDFYVLQPWEKKIEERGYPSSLIIKPSWASFVAAGGLFAALMKPMTKAMGYFWGFSLSGLLGLATYFGGTWLLTQRRLKQPPPPPKKSHKKADSDPKTLNPSGKLLPFHFDPAKLKQTILKRHSDDH